MTTAQYATLIRHLARYDDSSWITGTTPVSPHAALLSRASGRDLQQVGVDILRQQAVDGIAAAFG